MYFLLLSVLHLLPPVLHLSSFPSSYAPLFDLPVFHCYSFLSSPDSLVKDNKLLSFQINITNAAQLRHRIAVYVACAKCTK